MIILFFRERNFREQETRYCAPSVEPEKLHLVLPDWLPLQQLSLIVGPPSAGKGSLALTIAAPISTGIDNPSMQFIEE
jgi:hypothetical protein